MFLNSVVPIFSTKALWRYADIFHFVEFFILGLLFINAIIDTKLDIFKFLIGIFILIGNNYNWWLGDVQITSKESSKRVLIAEITSNDANMELVKHNLFKGNPGTRLEILLEEEKNSIYDELISYLNSSKSDAETWGSF